MVRRKLFLVVGFIPLLFPSCLAIELSDLDPANGWGRWMGLRGLLDFLRAGYFYEVPVQLRENGNLPGRFSLVRVTKVPLEYELPSLLNDFEKVGEHRGIFTNEAGIYKVRVRELGRYRIDFYDVQGQAYSYKGSLLLELNSWNAKLPTLLGSSMQPIYKVDFLPLHRKLGAKAPFLSLAFNELFRWMGESSGRSFVLARYLSNESSYVDTSTYSFIEYLVVIWTDDVQKFHSVLISELPCLSTPQVEQNFGVSDSIQDGGNLYFLLNVTEPNTIPTTYLVEIPVSNPKQYTLRPLSPRGSGNQFVSASYLKKIGNYIYYSEDDGTNNFQTRRELGVFQNPATNLALDTTNSNSPFYGGNSISSFHQFTDSAVLYPLGSTVYSMESSGIVQSPVTISHTSPLNWATIGYFTNPYRSFFFEDIIGDPDPVRISTLPVPFQFTNQTFSTTHSVSIPKTSDSTLVGLEFLFNSRKTIMQVFLFDSFLNGVEYRFFSYPHENTPPQEFEQNKAFFQTVPGYVEKHPTLNEMGLLGEKVFFIKRPLYVQEANPLLNPQKKGEFVLSCLEPTGKWTSWEVLDPGLSKLPPLPSP